MYSRIRIQNAVHLGSKHKLNRNTNGLIRRSYSTRSLGKCNTSTQYPQSRNRRTSNYLHQPFRFPYARHPLQFEISHRWASVASIRRMAYSLAKPQGAADRASPDGRAPLPLGGPGGGVATEDARRSERLIGNCRARGPRPGNVV